MEDLVWVDCWGLGGEGWDGKVERFAPLAVRAPLRHVSKLPHGADVHLPVHVYPCRTRRKKGGHVRTQTAEQDERTHAAS